MSTTRVKTSTPDIESLPDSGPKVSRSYTHFVSDPIDRYSGGTGFAHKKEVSREETSDNTRSETLSGVRFLPKTICVGSIGGTGKV